MSELTQEVQALRRALDNFEAKCGADSVPPGALEDFKVTVDSVRTSVLAMLTAEDPSEYRSFIRNYRLRRAAVVCQSVFSGLIDGTIDHRTPGFDQLQSTVEETLEQLDALEG